MDFKVIIYLLLIYSAFVKYLKNGNKTMQFIHYFFGCKSAYDAGMEEELHSSVIECVINMKLAILTKM